jgi:ribonuclease-3
MILGLFSKGDKYKIKIKELQKKLHYKFKKQNHIREALTHTSYVNENPQLETKSNETLEFLGDSVLGLLMAEYLYKKFPMFEEGKLSIMKSSFVSEPVLAEIAKEFDLGEYLVLGKGDERGTTRMRPSILSNALEAVIGAIYLDGGIKVARVFVHRLYEKRFDNIPENEVLGSFKNRLQHYTQTEFGCIPMYDVVAERGPSHNKIYEVAVVFNKEIHGFGKGTSKKRAEQEAAKAALVKLGLEK